MSVRPSHRPRGGAGFTLIELILVMLLVAALAVFALPRLVDTTLWRLRTFGDEMQSRMLAMQRQALAQRRPIVATIGNSGVSFAYASGTAISQLDCPAATSPCIVETGSVTFNQANQGNARTSSGTALTLTVSHGSYSQAYRLENETGLVYPTP